MDEQTKYQEAKKRVQEIKGFYYHLVSFILVNVFFVVINLLTSPEHLWFFWPLLGWGIGLVIHAFSVSSSFWGKSWEERKIKEIMDKDKRI